MERGGKEGCAGCHIARQTALRFSGDPAKDFRALVANGFFLKDDPGSLLERIVDASPKRKMFGARKSPIVPRAMSARMTAYPSGWRKLTWLPRAAASRGLTRPRACVPHRCSTSSMKRSPRHMDFFRISSRSHSRSPSTPTSSAASDSTGGVPQIRRPMPGAGR